MATLSDLLNKGLDVIDNIKLREFQVDMEQARLRQSQTLDWPQMQRNPWATTSNTASFDTSGVSQLANQQAQMMNLLLIGVVVFAATQAFD